MVRLSITGKIGCFMRNSEKNQEFMKQTRNFKSNFKEIEQAIWHASSPGSDALCVHMHSLGAVIEHSFKNT